MSHSVLKPSGAHRWVECAGYIRISRNIAPVDSTAANEGRVAHNVAENMVDAIAKNTRYPVASEIVGTIVDDVLITPEMYEGCNDYAAHCSYLMRESGVYFGDKMGIETAVTIPEIHDECYGTCDFWLFDTKTNTLHVVDFKFGFRPVSPVENWQLICYASGLMSNVNGITDQEITVVFHIVQPRAFGQPTVRTWSANLSDFRGFVNTLSYAAHAAMEPESGCKSGPHCADCEALLICDTARAAEVNGLDFFNERGDVIATDGDEMGRELDILKRAHSAIEYRIEAIQTEALARITRGERVNGYGIGYGRSSQKWTKPTAEVLALGDLMGKQLRKPETPITPKQAITLGLDKTIVDAFSETFKGSQKLKPQNQKAVKELLNNV